MIKVFIDTNVMIDFLGKSLPFYEDAAKIIVLAERQQFKLAASSLSFVNSFYVLSKVCDSAALHNLLSKFRIVCDVSNIDEINIDKSLILNAGDFEDAVQYYSALHHRCDIFITRNKKDFRKSGFSLMTPSEFLKTFKKK